MTHDASRSLTTPLHWAYYTAATATCCPCRSSWADELLGLVPLATYFARFVDSRTDVPLLPEPAFFLQLYLAALQSGIASLSQTEVSRRSYTREDKADRWFFARRRDLMGFIEYGLPDMGLLPGVAVWCSHEQLGKLVTEQISLYYAARNPAT